MLRRPSNSPSSNSKALPDLNQLHRYARAIFDHALLSVDPRKAVKQAIGVDRLIGDLCEARLAHSPRPIYAIAIGKAASSMALGLEDSIGEKLTAGLLSGPSSPGSRLASGRWKIFSGGHPLPNEASIEAARAAFAILNKANEEQAVVIFLVSGGGSAMIEWPVSEDITLEDLRLANQTLVASGARISEINAVRRMFSAVKGGALATRAPRARIVTLIVSDTNREDEASVASGPSLPPPPDAPDAIEVVESYHLESELPASILRSLRQQRVSIREPQQSERTHHVLLDNLTALEAAARKAVEFAFVYSIPYDISEQPIEKGCELLLSRLMSAKHVDHQFGGRFCLISGGEFSCPVRGNGRGGRNLETALRCAIGLEQTRSNLSEHLVVLSAGTDGIDGNSPAAGALADETTIEQARELGLEASEFLESSDSYGFFEKLNDAIVTGPTGTNVRDLRILLRSG